MKKYWLIGVFPLLLLLWWAVGRGASPVTVHFSSARQNVLESVVSTNGKVEPAEWAAASAQTSGVVSSVTVTRGQEIRAGQVLVVLDAAAAQADLVTASARENEAAAESATLSQGGKVGAVATITDSIASARAALDVAERAYEATGRLAEKQAATRLQLQDAKDGVERARLNLAAFQNQKNALVTSADRSVAGAKLRDAQAAVALARHKLTLEKILAPIAGTLYQFDLKVGAYLQPGELVALVGKLDQMKVSVYVDEPDLGRVALDMPVTITWDAHPGQKWVGRVNKLPTEVIALGTRTVGEVATVVENPHRDLLPGVSVNASIVSKVVADALSIPRSALRTLHGVTGVYKLAGKSLAWTPVSAGISDVNSVQIVSGLQAGDRVADRVVEPGDAEIRDGMRVKALFD